MDATPANDTIEIIRDRLTRALAPSHLEIRDDSHLHAGHAAARSGGGHYAVTLVAACFEGLDPASRHRLVYRALAEEMPGRIHALAIRALAPSEAPGAPNGTGRVVPPR